MIKLAYVHLYHKLTSKLKLINAPILTEDGLMENFSVNLYAEPFDDVCEMHFSLSEYGNSVITRLEDISVNTWCKRIESTVLDYTSHHKIYEIVLQQIVSAVNNGWVKLERCHPMLLDDMIQHDLACVQIVKTYKLTEYSKLLR